MTVLSMIERIVGLSHNEQAPDTDLQNRALGWLNSAYFELLTELQPYQAEERRVTVTLTTSALGMGTLVPKPQRVIAVVDATHATVLTHLRSEDFLARYPLPTDIGQPSVYRLNGAEIEVYPMGAVELQVTYIPEPTALTVLDGVSAIAVPEVYHNALIWGALVWGSLYERDFSAAADIKLFQAKWEEAKRAAKLALIHQVGRGLRVQANEELC